MENELRMLIDRRNKVSKELDDAWFELRNACIYPEDKVAQGRKVQSLETEMNKIIAQIKEIEDTAKKQKLTKKLKEIHQYIRVDSIPVGGIIPSGNLFVDENLTVCGKLDCGHDIRVPLVTLLKPINIESLLNSSTLDVSTFYACPVKVHSSDHHWQPVASYGRAYQLVFRINVK